MRSSDWSSDVCSSDLFLTLEGTIWQFTAGTRDRTRISPDNFWHVQYLLDRPGNQAIQLALFYDYRNNVALYPQWQALFREHQPPALVVRSEEHTSELQSLMRISYAVFCLKKKKTKTEQ